MTAWSPIIDADTATGAIITQTLMRAIQYNIRALAEDDASVPLADVISRLGRQTRIVCGAQDDDAVHQLQVGGAFRAGYATLGETAPTVNPRRILIGWDALADGKYAIQADQDGVGAEDLSVNPDGGDVLIGTDPGGAALVRIGGSVSIRAPMTWPAANAAGVLTNDGSGGLSWGATAAIAAFWAKVGNATELAITAAGSATLNRMHAVSGTSADYEIEINGLSPTTGDVLGFRVRDYAAADKQFKLDAGGTVKIAGRTRYLVLLHTNVVLLIWDGTDWQPLVLNLDTPWIDAGAIDLTAVTTNPTKGTGATEDEVRWRRVGDTMHVTYTYGHSVAGTNGSGDYLFGIPIGTIDTTKVVVDANAYDAYNAGYSADGFGVGYTSSNSVPWRSWVNVYSSTQLRNLRQTAAGATLGYQSSTAATGSLGSGFVRFRFTAYLPMTDW